MLVRVKEKYRNLGILITREDITIYGANEESEKLRNVYKDDTAYHTWTIQKTRGSSNGRVNFKFYRDKIYLGGMWDINASGGSFMEPPLTGGIELCAHAQNGGLPVNFYCDWIRLEGFGDKTSQMQEIAITRIDQKLGKFSSISFDGKWIYYIPSTGNKILRYDIDKSFIDSTGWQSLNISNFNFSETSKFLSSTYDGEYIYLVPGQYPFLRINGLNCGGKYGMN